MKFSFNKIKYLCLLPSQSQLILLALFLAAVIIRIPAVFQDLPPYLFCDESLYLQDTLRLWREQGFNRFLINEFKAGAINVYLPLILFKSINLVVGISTWGDREAVIAGRLLLSVFLNSLSIFFVYKTAEQLFEKKEIGLFAAFAFVLSPLISSISRIWYPDHFVIFFSAGTFYYISIILKNQFKIISYVMAGIFCGLTISTKYSGIFLLVPIGLVLGMNGLYVIQKKSPSAIRFLCLSAMMLGLIFLTTIVINFSALVKPEQFWQAFNWNINNYVPQAEVNIQGILFYIFELYVLSFGIFGIFIYIAGYLYVYKRYKKILPYVLFMPLIILSYMGGRYGVFVHRNMTLLIPFILPVFGLGLFRLITVMRQIKIHKPVAAIAIFGVICTLIASQSYQIFVTFKHDLRPDSRVEAFSWIEENLPEKSTIGVNEFCTGSSPADQNQHQLINDPLMTKALDYYVFNSYWDSPFGDVFYNQGLLQVIEQKYIHFYHLSSFNLYTPPSKVLTIDQLLPGGYIMLKQFSSNGPDILILQKVGNK